MRASRDALPAPYPKIELHVHLEGTVQPATLLEIARRNDVALPARNADELADRYRYRDFDHFVSVWVLTTQALRRADDFRRIVVEYAAEASAYGAAYIEAIFSPAEPVRRGSSWKEVFEGYCDGADEARELHGSRCGSPPTSPAATTSTRRKPWFDTRPPTVSGGRRSRPWRAGGRVPAVTVRARLSSRARERACLRPPRW